MVLNVVSSNMAEAWASNGEYGKLYENGVYAPKFTTETAEAIAFMVDGGSVFHLATSVTEVNDRYSKAESFCGQTQSISRTGYRDWSSRVQSGEYSTNETCKRCLNAAQKRALEIPSDVQVDKSVIKGIDTDWWVCVETGVECGSDKRILLCGPPGTGKTSIAHHLGRKHGRKVYNITVHEDLSAQEVLGHFIQKDGDTIWHDGPAIRAWKEGAWLVVNEIAEAAGPVLTALYGIMDDPDIAEIMLPSGEVVKPKEGFRLFATTNEMPESIPEALEDRFDTTLFADIPTPGAINALPTPINKMVENSYKSARKGSAAPTITYRQGKQFATKVKAGMNLGIAAKGVFGDTKGREFVRDYAIMAAAEAQKNNPQPETIETTE